MNVGMYVCNYLCMYICMCVCVCVHIISYSIPLFPSHKFPHSPIPLFPYSSTSSTPWRSALSTISAPAADKCTCRLDSLSKGAVTVNCQRRCSPAWRSTSHKRSRPSFFSKTRTRSHSPRAKVPNRTLKTPNRAPNWTPNRMLVVEAAPPRSP
ncbi:hypothetical protein B484DRAFT_236998 [Ochromonadaceae sp. CCMP2298]|nr:hypothetical protein B484DRAFT_236998 [Ochromonadaceae sp. CCMP2298]